MELSSLIAPSLLSGIYWPSVASAENTTCIYAPQRHSRVRARQHRVERLPNIPTHLGYDVDCDIQGIHPLADKPVHEQDAVRSQRIGPSS